MALVWLAVALVAGLVEVVSLDLVFIMIAGGALVAAGTAGLGASPVTQVVVFAIASAALLVAARPAARRWLARGAPLVATNTPALPGRRAQVLTGVDRDGGTVKLAGETWSARLDTPGAQLEPGAEVVVVRIEGATAVVRPVAGPPSGYQPPAAG